MGTLVGIAVVIANAKVGKNEESWPKDAIKFADPVVGKICAERWGDGTYITKKQAASVTSLGTNFSKNTTITSFDELGEFGVTSLADGRYGVFNGCSNLVSVDLSKITIIGETAFKSCPLFAGNGNGDLRIPNLTSIGNNSFGGYNRGTCTGLKRVLDLGRITTIPDDTNTYQGTFRHQLNLTDVVLPETLTKIGKYAFFGCTALKRISITADTPPTLGSAAFANCPALTGIYVPDESVEAYKAATNWSAYANKILPLSQFNG